MIAYYCYLVTQVCLTLCDPMDYSPPGSSVPGILQARILEWVAIAFSDSLYANLKKKMSKLTYLQNNNKLTESGFMVTRGMGRGDRLRVWD